MEEATDMLDNGEPIDVIYQDFAKAFGDFASYIWRFLFGLQHHP